MTVASLVSFSLQRIWHVFGFETGTREMKADLVLLHAPAYFDFRDRDDILFPYLSTGGDVPITAVYEVCPLGFRSLQSYLESRGRSVSIINLASTMICRPSVDVRALLERVDARLFGIDLHWLVHAQGALKIASLVRSIHPETPIIFGGMAATYFADELIRLPQVDMVMRGYDTHEPMAQLLDELTGARSFDRVENLSWKEGSQVRKNRMSHAPQTMRGFVDWTRGPARTPRSFSPFELISTISAGCTRGCTFCSGAARSSERTLQMPHGVALRRWEDVRTELASLGRVPGRNRCSLYVIGAYNLSSRALVAHAEMAGDLGLKSVTYEIHRLPKRPKIEGLLRVCPRLRLSYFAQSHDPVVAAASGSHAVGVEALGDWIEMAFEAGLLGFDLWYCVGLPHQTRSSVFQTVDLVEALLDRFPPPRLNVAVAPLIPLLDPGSAIFESPEQHGYTVFHRTLEEHRRGLARPSLIQRMNYETRWLTRRDLVVTACEAIQRVVEKKGARGYFAESVAKGVSSRVREAVELILAVDDAELLPDALERAHALADLGPAVQRHNARMFSGTVSSLAFPIPTAIGDRWFDEIPS
jgi:clorobiocin/coumermycin A biosynthesis protein CloN6/CouN6